MQSKPKLLVLEANKVVYFNNPEKLWIIHSGEVELYFIDLGEDRIAKSPRKHIYNAKKGMAIMSWSDQVFAGGVTLMGTSPGAKLIEYTLADESLFDQTSINKALEEWVEHTSIYFLEQRSHVDFIHLHPGTIDKIKKNVILASQSDLLWVKILEGEFNILGDPDMSSEEVSEYNDAAFIPVSKYFWMWSNDKKGRLEVKSRDEIPNNLFFKECINPLRNYCGQEITYRFEYDQDEERQALQLRRDNNDFLVKTSLQKLQHVLTSDLMITESAVDKNEDLLFQCCQVIGRAMDKVVSKPKHFDPKDNKNALFLIARASNMRFRKVILRGEWWKEENGNLLVYDAESHEPRAILQSSSGKYSFFNPETRTTEKLSKEHIESLDPIAHMFFATFDKPITSIKQLTLFAFKGIKRDVLWLLFAALLGSIFGLLVPVLSSVIFDDIIPSADRSYLWEVFAIFVVVAFIHALLSLGQGVLLLRLETKTNLTLQAGLMDHLIRLPMRFFTKYSAGDLTLRALTVNSIREIASTTLLSATLVGAFSLMNLTVLFYYDARLTWIGLGIAFIGVLFITIMAMLKLKYDRQIADVEGEIQGLLFQLLSGIDKIRISGAEPRVFALWADKFKKLKSLDFNSGSIQNWVEVVQGSFPLLTNIFFFFFIYQYYESSIDSTGSLISVGIFIAFITAYMQFLDSSMDMAYGFISALNIIPLYERVKPILEEQPETGGDFKDIGKLIGHIEFNQVHFKYDTDQPLVLQDVSFKIEAGEMVAFVGPSGSGKSTVLRILLGFESPGSGSVYYDGLEFATLNKDLLRQQLGVVLQDGALMPGSILENIVGNSSLTITDAWEAVKMAGIEEDIRAMPMGIHTVISEGSSTISGGQKQRLVIARALVHRPSVIFMDEATSALDNQTQKIVKESLDRLQATRIVVAHRLSTIKNADRIFVMDKGRIVETGSYDELVKMDGLFAQLAKRQVL